MVGSRFSLLLWGIGAFITTLPSLLSAQTAPTFTSTPVVTGSYGSFYSYAITTDDAEASPREIVLTNGTLPIGISLVDNGDGTASLQGNPTNTGIFALELTVRETGAPFLEEIQSFNLVIDKALLTVTPQPASRVYGQANPTFTVSITGFLNGDNEADLDVLPTASTSATVASSVGSYTISASGGSDNNYAFSYQPAQLTVTQATLTATADDKSIVYGQSLPGFTISYLGFVNGDDASDLATEPTVTTSATATSGAGGYTLTVSGGVDANYTFAYQTGTLTIQKATLQVVADDKTRVYGAANPALTFNYSGFVHGDDAADLDTEPVIGTIANSSSGVGNYAITVSGGSDNDYQYNFIDGNLSITQATLTVTADNKSRVYGAVNPTLTFTYSGFLNGDDASDINTPPTANTIATVLSPVGSYGIGVSGGVDNNYFFSYNVGQLTITKASLTISVNNATREYGQVNPLFTYSYAGFVNGDDAVDINVLPTTTTAATGTSAVGAYPVVLSGGSDDNYTFTFTSGTLTVTKATLIVTADDKTRLYGAANPALTISYAGFLNGDDALDINTPPVASTTANTTTSVGNYVITVAGGTDNNYAFTFVNGTLSITKAMLTVTAANKSRAYGAANPLLTFSYSGFLNGDDALDLNTPPTATTTAAVASDVGSYPITLGGGSDNNYDFTYVDALLTVTKATLTVIAENKTRIYDTPNPALTFVYAGFLNGDDGSDIDVGPSLATTAIQNSNVGTYPITPSGGTDNNYSFAYVAGTLTITKATATVQITDLLQNVTGSPRPVTITTSPVGLSVTVLYNGSASVPSVKGTYAITATINEINYQGSATATYILNGPPVLLSSPSLSFNEDSGNHTINLSLHVDDTEQTEATLLYEITSNSNTALLQVASVSGFTLTVNPAPDKYGTATLGIRVTDSQGMTLNFNATITVSNVQDAPVFTSTAITTGVQDVLYTYSITATDVDLSDVLTISSVIALPSWLSLINPGNGTATLTGTPREANIGVHGIALRVTDDKGNSTNQFFNITVFEGQFPPEFTSAPILTARENTPYTYTATTSDFNGGPITYAATTLPAWLTATANGTGGFVLSGTPGFSNVFFENGGLEYPVVITATDNTGLNKTQSFQIKVLYENSPPTVILPFASLTVNEDAAVTDVALTGITDGGEVGQVITFVPTSNPAGIVQTTVSYQSPQTTGTLRIQPLPNMHGTTTVSVRVQDNGKASKNFAVKELIVTVTPVNDAPEIVSTPIVRVNPGATYSYTVTATDVDASDVLTFQKLIGPAWLTISTINNRDGLLTGTVPANATDVLVRVQTSDQTGATDFQEFTLIINKAPVVQSSTAEVTEDATVNFDKAYFQNLITDANPTDVVSFLRITKLPLGELKHNGQLLSLNAEIPWVSFTQISYTPPLDYFGADAFEWNVSDGLLLAATAAKLELNVSTENDPPVIRNLETSNITYSQGDGGAAISSSLTLLDVDNANLVRAVVTISQSFEAGTDVLSYVKPDGDTSPITSSFNNQTGELLLEGEASKSAYETALRNVKFRSTFLGNTVNLSRQISIRVADLVSESQTVTRNLTIIRVLPDIEIVNAFTPNGDGVNDTWDFSNLIAYTDIEILVYDGKGQRVYECRDSNCAWDGTRNGKELPAGPYLYTIKLEEGRRQYQGTVTLLK